jgi:outer membrane protein OmpA-like peptidoglycan-associated protein
MASFSMTKAFRRKKMKKSKVFNIIPLLSLFLLLTVSAFAQLDVPRQTTAVTYPLDEAVNLQFRGTTRFPRMKGTAKIKRTSKNGTEIDLSVSRMPRPFELGAGYATYVLWAISPDGQVDNLGEIKRRGFFEFDSNISVTTRLQTFALIITAEPHFLVRRPSRAIMLENLNPYAVSGRTLATTQAVQYFGNSSDYFNDARTPLIADLDYSKTPSTILQAKQAVALAKFAGAQRDAASELNEAETLAQNAEKAWQAGRSEEEVDITARKAISAAVKAEDTASVRKEAREKRNEQTRQDEEVRKTEEKFSDVQTQMNDLKSELARETRNRELAERDALNFSNQVKDIRAENQQLRDDLAKAKAEAEDAKVRLARLEGEKQAIEKQQEQSNRLNQIQANQATLMQSLKRFGTVTKDERGIVLTLPETFWSGIRVNTFAPASETKLSSLGEVLAGMTDYKIMIESHTDDKGTADELQNLTQQRADAIAEKLKSAGVNGERIETKGFGATSPVAANTTNANRAKNRRVQVILVPNI